MGWANSHSTGPEPLFLPGPPGRPPDHRSCAVPWMEHPTRRLENLKHANAETAGSLKKQHGPQVDVRLSQGGLIGSDNEDGTERAVIVDFVPRLSADRSLATSLLGNFLRRGCFKLICMRYTVTGERMRVEARQKARHLAKRAPVRPGPPSCDAYAPCK